MQLSNHVLVAQASCLWGTRASRLQDSMQDACCPHRPEACATMSSVKNFWLVKQEPTSYSWSDFVADGETNWTGVRNYTARNNLRRMHEGDEVLFYHSGEEKAVVGIAKVMRTAYADPTAREGDWNAVDLASIKSLRRPVTLREIKDEPRLSKIQLVRQSRLSVMPLSSAEFQTIVLMGDTKGGESARQLPGRC
jgi:predicted RNA-binding protein with PUA-like domain